MNNHGKPPVRGAAIKTRGNLSQFAVGWGSVKRQGNESQSSNIKTYGEEIETQKRPAIAGSAAAGGKAQTNPCYSKNFAS